MIKNILKIAVLSLALCGTATIAEASPMMELIEIENNIQIYVVNNQIHVSGGYGQKIAIYNVLGVQIYSGRVDSQDRKFDLSLPSGCYIVKVGNVTRKVSIK